MAVGFPPGVVPKEERVVATGMVRTRVLVPVVIAPRLCMGVGSFTLVACETHKLKQSETALQQWCPRVGARRTLLKADVHRVPTHGPGLLLGSGHAHL